MSVKYQDYYKILGIERNASQDEIKNAYKKMAKKYHPDVNKSKDAEESFKKANEAYEVLKDPEKRKKYDQFGDNWQSGQDFNPGNYGGFQGGQGFKSYDFSSRNMGASGFSDFFESIFGGGFSNFSDGTGQKRASYGYQDQEIFKAKGADRTAKITLSVREAFKGGPKTIALNVLEPDGKGRSRKKIKRYQINIPEGAVSGTKLRMKNMGEPGISGGPPGDLIIELVVANDSIYRLEGQDIIRTVEINFYDAILGTKKNVDVLGKNIEVTIPSGTQSNQKLRIREMGMPSKTKAGDLYFEIKVKIPKDLSSEQEKYIKEAKKIFN